jgi:hypothetical protein
MARETCPAMLMMTSSLALSAADVNTFSIVAYDPATGDCGVTVASKYFSVGAVVPWAEGGTGCIATQANVNVGYGPRGLGGTPDRKQAVLRPPDTIYREIYPQLRQPYRKLARFVAET